MPPRQLGVVDRERRVFTPDHDLRLDLDLETSGRPLRDDQLRQSRDAPEDAVPAALAFLAKATLLAAILVLVGAIAVLTDAVFAAARKARG